MLRSKLSQRFGSAPRVRHSQLLGHRDLTFVHSTNAVFDLRGAIAGNTDLAHFPRSQSNFGISDAYREVSRSFSFSNSFHIVPYAELGLHNQFPRPIRCDRLVTAVWNRLRDCDILHNLLWCGISRCSSDPVQTSGA
jgi:hypothetical protein